MIVLKKFKKHYDLFTVSHNKTEIILYHLEKEGLKDYFFKGVFGSDKIPIQKPGPMALQSPLKLYNKRKTNEFVMIGDMLSDIIVGQ
ncbi:MAG: HAD family hydrolase [Candidatus Hodarchaeota archaeon]